MPGGAGRVVLARHACGHAHIHAGPRLFRQHQPAYERGRGDAVAIAITVDVHARDLAAAASSCRSRAAVCASPATSVETASMWGGLSRASSRARSTPSEPGGQATCRATAWPSAVSNPRSARAVVSAVTAGICSADWGRGSGTRVLCQMRGQLLRPIRELPCILEQALHALDILPHAVRLDSHLSAQEREGTGPQVIAVRRSSRRLRSGPCPGEP